jgi:hypothetical protein
VNEDDCGNLSTRARDTRATKDQRATVVRNPCIRRLPGTVSILDLDRAAEADHEVPTQRLQKPIQLLIAEPAIGQQRDLHVGREACVQPLDEPVLVVVAFVLERRLAHRHPDQRRRSPVVGDQVACQRRVVVAVELGPVEREHDLLALCHDELRPRSKQRPHVDACIAKHPVGLLDAMPLVVVGDASVPTTDGVNRQHSSVDGADHSVCQRQHAHR